MTRQFFEQLPTDIRSNVLFSYVTTYLEQRRSGKQTLDIEDVLWAFGDLLTAIKNAIDPGNILQHLFSTNQIHSVTKLNPSGSEVLNQLADLSKKATSLRHKIHDEVYRYYVVKPENSELEHSWIPLLKWLRGLNPEALDIVTTNYDLVIESALDAVGDIPIDTGKRATVDVSLDLSLWDRGRPPSSGLLTKLHGSVDWRYAAKNDPVTIRWGHPEHDGQHETRGIIYPGFKGIPQKEPFKSFHDYFGNVVGRATHLIFIGFAFRDEHINTLLERAPSPTARIAVIDPCTELPPLPFLSSANHIPFPFGAAEPETFLGGSSIPKWLNHLELWMSQTQ